MGDAPVTTRFDEPQVVRETDKAYIIGKGDDYFTLPKSKTILTRNDDGKATSFTIPEWLAEKREEEAACPATRHSPETPVHSTPRGGPNVYSAAIDAMEMSREDWFLLGSTMAMLFGGEPPIEAVRKGRQVVNRMMEEERFDE